MQSLTCGFIGLGLIGGSLAKALKKFLPDTRIYAYDINPESLRLAKEDGICDLALSDIGTEFLDCNYVFLCAPVSCNDENLKKLVSHISPDAVLSDVGSVKSQIHKHVEAAGLSDCFIGGHPMAGSERFGYQNAKAGLLENAYYILTPSASVCIKKLHAYQDLVRTLGAIPLVLTCEEHDYVTACISHLPHVIAASLVSLVKDHDNENGTMKAVAAGGFKDITRIASSSPAMWQNICLSNPKNISALLGDFIRSLTVVREQIDACASDAIYQFFDEARSYRESFIEASSGPIKKVFTLNVDIPDEPGALAAIATILALHGISIKNIGIVHNREFEEGVLRIEFYEQAAADQARQLLLQKGYTIHLKH